MSLFDWKGGDAPALPPLCEHRMFRIEMPDGVVYYASRHHVRQPNEQKPDYGLYLDPIWQPDVIAFYVHWRDFGVPSLQPSVFVELCEYMYVLAQNGAVIEVGCIGGHGRTGTMMACLALQSGLEPEAAIDFVRAKYCDRAVETEQQEWWVERIYAEMYGLPFEPMPVPPPSKYTPPKTSKGVTDWAEYSGTDKGAHKGEFASVKIDASGVEYCAACLVDLATLDAMECAWCGASFKAKD